MNDNNKMLNNLMDMACELMGCNADIHRIEDTINRMGLAYGAAEMNVFVITASVIITMVLPDGTRLTQTRRIHGPYSFRFEQLIRLNALSRAYCAQPCSPDELGARLAEIAHSREGEPLLSRSGLAVCLGSMLVGGTFALFFGGTAADGIAGAVCGALTYFTQAAVKRFAPNQLIFQLLNALVIGAVIQGACLVFPALHADKIMIGDIMLLVPGIAMTNALKDILTGETISGLLRLVETILWAAALAAGFMVSMALLHSGFAEYESAQMPALWQLVLSFAGALGFALVFRVPRAYLLPAAAGGVLCWGGYLLGTNALGLSVFAASVFTTAGTSVYAELAAKRLKMPAPAVRVCAYTPLIPGGGLYYTMHYVVAQDWAQASVRGTATLMCALGMAFGMSLVFAAFDVIRARRA